MKRKFTEKQINILEVAEELIAKKGFDGTSVRDICTKANINVAMISYYFGSKEKMLTYLYQYRVQRTRESFSEFSQVVKDGKPEMQMKEIIKFIIGLFFKYNYFHGFVNQEIRHTDVMKDELLEFYNTVVDRLDDIVKRGIASGVFHNAPKSEDMLTTIIGPTLFVIRNKKFYEIYIPNSTDENYMQLAEVKARASAYQTIFSLLGYQPD